MIRIGLTGSIGMGKSAVARMFAREGVPVFDADACVHQLQGPSGAAVAAIEARFPGTVGPRGVDRQALGKRVFANPAERAALEEIVHPLVARARQAFLRRNRSRPLAVLDIPLLFETGGEKRVDVTITVSAPAFVQRRRVLARPGMSLSKLRRILESQLPDSQKRRRADFIIETSRPMWRTQSAVRQVIKQLTACHAGATGR